MLFQGKSIAELGFLFDIASRNGPRRLPPLTAYAPTLLRQPFPAIAE